MRQSADDPAYLPECPQCGENDPDKLRVRSTAAGKWFRGKCETCGFRTNLYRSQAEVEKTWLSHFEEADNG